MDVVSSSDRWSDEEQEFWQEVWDCLPVISHPQWVTRVNLLPDRRFRVCLEYYLTVGDPDEFGYMDWDVWSGIYDFDVNANGVKAAASDLEAVEGTFDVPFEQQGDIYCLLLNEVTDNMADQLSALRVVSAARFE